MENEYSEPEEKTTKPVTEDAQVVPDQDMLTSEVKNDRSGASTSASGPTVGEFNPPPFTGTVEDEDQQPKDPADNPMANPELKDAPPHVKQKGAEFLADKLLLGYKGIKIKIATLAIIIGERKIDKWEDKGIVNRAVLLPLKGGGAIPAGLLVEQHNETAEAVIEENALTKEFYDEALPMITEELSKRNIALTNVQQLLAITAMDLYSYGEKLKPLFDQKQDMIHAFKQATAAYKAAPQGFQPAYAQTQPTGNSNGQQPPAPSEPEQPQPTPEPVYTPPQPTGNVNTAFDDLQEGRDIMSHGVKVPLPSEFAEMEAGRQRPVKIKKPRKKYTRTKPYTNRNKKSNKIKPAGNQ